MKRLSEIITSVGLTIAVLGACCLDSPGIYGYAAGAVGILGGFVAGVGYAVRILGERREKDIFYFHQRDRLTVDVEWIELEAECNECRRISS